MHYQLYAPQAALSGFVRAYWSLEGQELPGSRQRVFPDGCIELVFHYGDLFSKYHPGETVLQPRSFIHGQLTRFIEIGGNGCVGVFSVRFHPHGLRPFIDVDLAEISNANIPLKEIWGAAGDELEDQVLNAGSNEQRVQIIERFLRERMLRKPIATAVQNGLVMIDRKKGILPIHELSLELNIGQRQFERQFLSAVGLTPKQYARITRFQHTLFLAGQNRFHSLTELAYSAGFYDQAHFIKDFRELSGLSPKQYFSEQLPLVKFFSLE
jgi:AraC-like DNA-binding protein